MKLPVHSTASHSKVSCPTKPFVTHLLSFTSDSCMTIPECIQAQTYTLPFCLWRPYPKLFLLLWWYEGTMAKAPCTSLVYPTSVPCLLPAPHLHRKMDLALCFLPLSFGVCQVQNRTGILKYWHPFCCQPRRKQMGSSTLQLWCSGPGILLCQTQGNSMQPAMVCELTSGFSYT